MSEFRYNKLAKHWVLFAPNRAKRPSNFEAIKENEKDITNCPFEKGNESQTPNEVARIEDEKGWKCRVVPNLYHALSIDEDISSYKTGCFENKSGFGAHEVIIETPYHHKTMFEFTHEEFYDYFSIIKLRIDDLKKDIRLKYFSVFKNFGVNGTHHISFFKIFCFPSFINNSNSISSIFIISFVLYFISKSIGDSI